MSLLRFTESWAVKTFWLRRQVEAALGTLALQLQNGVGDA